MVKYFESAAMTSVDIFNTVHPKVDGLGNRLVTLNHHDDVFSIMSSELISYHMSEVFLYSLPADILQKGIELNSDLDIEQDQLDNSFSAVNSVHNIMDLIPEGSPVAKTNIIDEWESDRVHNLKLLLEWQLENIPHSADPDMMILDVLSRQATGHRIHDLVRGIKNDYPVKFGMVNHSSVDNINYFEITSLVYELERMINNIRDSSKKFLQNSAISNI